MIKDTNQPKPYGIKPLGSIILPHKDWVGFLQMLKNLFLASKTGISTLIHFLAAETPNPRQEEQHGFRQLVCDRKAVSRLKAAGLQLSMLLLETTRNC